MSESDDQSATHVGLLHGQDKKDGNLSDRVARKKIIENETEQENGLKCMILKSDPPPPPPQPCELWMASSEHQQKVKFDVLLVSFLRKNLETQSLSCFFLTKLMRKTSNFAVNINPVSV